MAERPFENQNWQRRKYSSYSPYFRIDTGNPQMGLNGSEIYDLYSLSDNGDISLIGASQGGMLHIYNDQTIEIIAGQKSTTTGVDIVITGKNGDVWITAEKNGQIRIRGSNIVVDADENLTLRAGNNILLDAGNRIDLNSNILNSDSIEGNLAPYSATFGYRTFVGTYVGSDTVRAGFNIRV